LCAKVTRSKRGAIGILAKVATPPGRSDRKHPRKKQKGKNAVVVWTIRKTGRRSHKGNRISTRKKQKGKGSIQGRLSSGFGKNCREPKRPFPLLTKAKQKGKRDSIKRASLFVGVSPSKDEFCAIAERERKKRSEQKESSYKPHPIRGMGELGPLG